MASVEKKIDRRVNRMSESVLIITGQENGIALSTDAINCT
jgi:hypothetical protein